jgi:hypothetical protein
MMDLNQLYSSHQVALYNAGQAGTHDERQTWRDLVDFYAARITRFREQRDLPRYSWS